MSAAASVRHNWFSRAEVAGGVTLLREPRVHGLLRCNIWRFDGDRPLWVDAGTGVRPPLAEFPEDAARSPVLVLTHAHVDHTGGAAEFGDVRMHPADMGRARTPPLPLTREAVTRHLGLGPAPLGVPLPDSLVQEWGTAGTPAVAGVGPEGPITSLHEGELLIAGDYRFEVLELPGHTPGSIGLWDDRCGVLVSGDALYRGTLLDDLPESNRARYHATMQQILNLRPRQVLPGHGPPLTAEETAAIASEYLSRRAHAADT